MDFTIDSGCNNQRAELHYEGISEALSILFDDEVQAHRGEEKDAVAQQTWSQAHRSTDQLAIASTEVLVRSYSPSDPYHRSCFAARGIQGECTTIVPCGPFLPVCDGQRQGP